MHYAVHGHTAAELIYERADAEKPHMGLTTWAAAPDGKIVKSDVSIAKNYLSEQEMRSLYRIGLSGFGRRPCRTPHTNDNGGLVKAVGFVLDGR